MPIVLESGSILNADLQKRYRSFKILQNVGLLLDKMTANVIDGEI